MSTGKSEELLDPRSRELPAAGTVADFRPRAENPGPPLLLPETQNRVLVLSRNELFARWVAACLDYAGYSVDVMGGRAWSLARLSRHCRAYQTCSTTALLRQDPSLLDLLNSYCHVHRIGWIVPADLPATLLLARGRHLLKTARTFPGSPAALLEQWNDKARFAQLLGELGLPTPHTVLLSSEADPAVRSLEYPLVLKPPRGEGGVGVRRVDSRARLLEVLPGHGEKFGWPLLAQEYIPGHDIDLSFLADHGRIVAWTIQRAYPRRPETLEFLEHPQVLDLGRRLAQACEFHGISHMDMRIDERTNEPLFVEANPRFWGSLRHSLWSGVNFPQLGLMLARGEDPRQAFQPVGGLCSDPGFATRSAIKAFLQGRSRPDGLSPASEAGWRCHVRDPLPQLWQRLRGLCVRGPNP